MSDPKPLTNPPPEWTPRLILLGMVATVIMPILILGCLGSAVYSFTDQQSPIGAVVWLLIAVPLTYACVRLNMWFAKHTKHLP